MSADPVEIAVDVGTDVEDKYRKEEREADGLRRQDEEYRRSRTSAEALQSDDVEDGKLLLSNITHSSGQFELKATH